MGSRLKGLDTKQAISEEKFELGEVGDLEVKTGSTEDSELTVEKFVPTDEVAEIKDVVVEAPVKKPSPKRTPRKKTGDK